MEQFKSNLRKFRGVSEKTITQYGKALNGMCVKYNTHIKNFVPDTELGKPYTGNGFLEDTEAIKNFLESQTDGVKNYKLGTRKNYLAAVKAAVCPNIKVPPKKAEDIGTNMYLGEKHEEIYNFYYDLRGEYVEAYEQRLMEQKKTAKMKKDWVSWKDIVVVRDNYLKEIKKHNYRVKNCRFVEFSHRELFKKYLLSCLYTYHPPRRNDYAKMNVIPLKFYIGRNIERTVLQKRLEEKDFQDQEELESTLNRLDQLDHELEHRNYLIYHSRNKKEFVFGDYKDSARKKYGVQKFPVAVELNSAINLWLNYKTQFCGLETVPYKADHIEPLFDSFYQTADASNSLTKYMPKVWEKTGKKIGTTMLRHIYLSDKYGDDTTYIDKYKDAVWMSHSVDTQQKTYVKH